VTGLRIRYLAAALIVGGGCTSQRPPAAREVVVWHTVGSWSGRGNAQTSTFGSDTGALRVRWETTNEASQGTGHFRVTLHSAVSGRKLTVAADQQGIGAGEAIAAETSPVVYAFVESTDLDWSFSVDEALIGITTEASVAAH
jgi:hypothetical protein